MTPTPRTDEALRNRPRYGIIEPAFVHADFARQLERELAEANAIIAEYPDGAMETLRKWHDEKKRTDSLKDALDRVHRGLDEDVRNWDKYPDIRDATIGSLVALRDIAKSALDSLNAESSHG